MKIKLTKFTIAHAEENFYKVGDEPLTLEFETDYDISDGQILLKNGDSIYTDKLRKKMVLPASIAKAGRIMGTVTIFKGAQVLKEWQILPIAVQERSQHVEAFDELFRKLNDIENCLNEKVYKLEKKIAELEEKTNIIL